RMSNPESSSPEPPESSPPPGRPRGREGRKPDKNQSSNLFLYLVIGIVLAFFAFSFVGDRRKGDRIEFSEFLDGLASGKWDKTSVHELIIGRKYVTFQDQPSKSSEGGEGTSATIRYYHVPIYSMGDEDRGELRQRLTEKGIKFGYEEPPPEWQSAASLLLLLL